MSREYDEVEMRSSMIGKALKGRRGGQKAETHSPILVSSTKCDGMPS